MYSCIVCLSHYHKYNSHLTAPGTTVRDTLTVGRIRQSGYSGRLGYSDMGEVGSDSPSNTRSVGSDGPGNTRDCQRYSGRLGYSDMGEVGQSQ
jgi:hypothetical protein